MSQLMIGFLFGTLFGLSVSMLIIRALYNLMDDTQ